MFDAARLDWSDQPSSVSPIATPRTAGVNSAAAGTALASGANELASSWRRSINEHGVDPLDNQSPRILTQHELKDRREPLGELLYCAQEEIERLHKVVREAGYTVSLCDKSGVALEHRGEDGKPSGFEPSGLGLGGIWSEDTEGTNGIGTSIAEERVVTVHRRQHFKLLHSKLSCSGAPIFGIDGQLVAVLGVSAVDPRHSERGRALTGALAANSARAVEERFFRQRFAHEWVVAIAPSAGDARGVLLAVDAGQRIVGANRVARTTLSLEDRRLQAGVGLWSIFQRNLELFRHLDGRDIPVRLVVAGSDDRRSALVTPPIRSLAACYDATHGCVHARPRLDAIDTLASVTPAPRVSGGLTPLAVRRIQQYVEGHLSDTIDLATLASIAGVSKCHFVRAFKKSVGATPHRYLIQKRVEQAHEMLARSHHSLSEIAFAVGFSDQSHMGHHFHQICGVTPGRFRASQNQEPADPAPKPASASNSRIGKHH